MHLPEVTKGCLFCGYRGPIRSLQYPLTYGLKTPPLCDFWYQKTHTYSGLILWGKDGPIPPLSPEADRMDGRSEAEPSWVRAPKMSREGEERGQWEGEQRGWLTLWRISERGS